MNITDLPWGDLLIALVSAIAGWLLNILRPAPGTTRKAKR